MARLILRLVSTLAVGLVLLVPVCAAAQPNKDHSIVLEDVSLGGGVTAEIHLKVFVNENQPCRAARRTHFVVHGLGHSAPTWGPLAEELFENNPPGSQSVG